MLRNKKEMYRQIYKVTYLANINGIIEENKYIDMLQKLSMEGFKTYHIDDFDRLTMYMQNIGLNDSFNISLLLYLRDTNYKQLANIAIEFDDIRKIFSVKKKKMVNRVHSIRRVLKYKLNIIRSFKKLDSYEVISNIIDVESSLCTHENTIKDIYLNDQIDASPKTDLSSDDQVLTLLVCSLYPTGRRPKGQTSSLVARQGKDQGTGTTIKRIENKMSPQKIKNEWKYHTRNEIISRLSLIAHVHYTVSQLKYMGVEIKRIKEIENLKYEELERYYTRVVGRIENSLKEWEMLCRMYIDVEINYIECCQALINNRKTVLKLKNFSVKINEE